MWHRFFQKKWIFIGVLLLVIVGGIFYRSRRTQTKPLSYLTLAPTTIEETIEVPGKMDAITKAELKFLAGGKLVSMPVKEGMTVKKGAIIAGIDAADLQKNLQSSLLDYSSTRNSFEQGIDDRKDLAMTDELKRTASTLQNTLDKSVVSVELRDIAIKNAFLRTPISGIVTALPVTTPGVQVTATDVFEIVDPQSLLFEGEVDEVDIGKVHVGTPVRISIDAYPDKRIDGVIGFIGLKARNSTKSSGGTVFPIRVYLPFTDIFTYRLGLNGTMAIIIAHKDSVLAVPIEATSLVNGKTIVKVKSSDAQGYTEKEITTGIEGDTTIEVLSGLQPGDQIVLP